MQLGAVTQFKRCALYPVIINDSNLHIAANNDHIASSVLQRVGVAILDFAFLTSFLETLLATLCNTTDVECAHRQLRARFTNGLRRDDANSFTHVYTGAACKVTTIADSANTLFRLTGQRRTDFDRCQTCGFDRICLALVNQFTFGDDHFARCRCDDIFARRPA